MSKEDTSKLNESNHDMAWNEPGGNGSNGSKDPWGNKGSKQDGPPDLDEVFKKLNEKVTSLFGGKGGKSGGGSGSAAGGAMGIGFIAIVAVVIWALSGIYIVKEGREAVVLQFGEFNEITDPGMHWYPRFIQSVLMVDVEAIRAIHVGQGSTEALMLTKDQNIVDMEFIVQYRVNDAKKFLFSARNPEISLRHAIQSAVRELSGNHDMNYIRSSGREQIAQLAKENIQNIVNVYDTGLIVASFNMQQPKPPAEVQTAYDDVLAAEEDRNRYINEAQAYRNDILPKAKGQKQRMLENAEGYKQEVISKSEGETKRFLKVLTEYKKAPRVTRERLYIDAMESVYLNSKKVMVDVKKGNNLLYLPLDRLTSPSSNRSNDMIPRQGTTSSNSNSLLDAINNQRDSRSRDRETR